MHHTLALALMPKMSPLKASSSRGVLASVFVCNRYHKTQQAVNWWRSLQR
jgi:hypothetical protein